MNLNKYQEKIVKAQEPYVVVNASAAAGKTQTLTERVRFLSQKGVPKDYIVVITFTNAAAEEMMERLGDDGYGIFIGTIHSYANYLLKCCGYDTESYLNDEDFDKLFEEVEEVYAGWFNNKILLRVQYFNRICDYSLQEFVGKIQNELVITDKSEKGRLIHIYIDVTSNEKTEIVIENIEN